MNVNIRGERLILYVFSTLNRVLFKRNLGRADWLARLHLLMLSTFATRTTKSGRPVVLPSVGASMPRWACWKAQSTFEVRTEVKTARLWQPLNELRNKYPALIDQLISINILIDHRKLKFKRMRLEPSEYSGSEAGFRTCIDYRSESAIDRQNQLLPIFYCLSWNPQKHGENWTGLPTTKREQWTQPEARSVFVPNLSSEIGFLRMLVVANGQWARVTSSDLWIAMLP